MTLQWTVTVERSGGDLPPNKVCVATFSRPTSKPTPADFGLCLNEARALLCALQTVVAQDQIRSFDRAKRRCPHCKRYRRIKDWRARSIDTTLGRVHVRVPRVISCQCLPEPLDEDGEICELRDTECSVERLLPSRRTPELSYLCAKHGAKNTYRSAAQSIRHMCALKTLGHATVRRETIACGEEIEEEQCLAGWLSMTGQSKRSKNGAKHLRVAIDGTVITSTPNDEFRKFEVIAGRVERDGHPGRRFVCAMQRRSLTRLLVAGALAQSGLTRSTVVDVVNDGARGMRKLVEDVTPKLAPRMIDWFHIAMKLHALRTPIEARTCYWWVPRPDILVRCVRLVSKLRDTLWRGKAAKAVELLRTIEATLRLISEEPGEIEPFFQANARTSQGAAKRLLDFLENNQDDLVDYQKERMAGRRISTASAESVMNHLINRRMSKRQQMRWWYASAHRMLLVRAELLDGQLEQTFERRFPHFRSPEMALE